MFSLEVRDHVMIAHSLAGEAFGPAQQLHGATYVIDLAFMRPALDENDIVDLDEERKAAMVVDIGLASEALKRVIAPINYRNLDELDDFSNRRSTTEALAKWVYDRMAEEIAAGRLGAAAKGIARLRVTLHESHVARAAFEADLPQA